MDIPGTSWFELLIIFVSFITVAGLFAGAVVGLVALWRSLGRRDDAGPARTPLDILRERYARGEIDRAEYEERTAVLRGDAR